MAGKSYTCAQHGSTSHVSGDERCRAITAQDEVFVATDIDKVVTELKRRANFSSGVPERAFLVGIRHLLKEAADAIEALQKETPPVEYGFTGSVDPNAPEGFVHGPYPTIEHLMRHWGPQGHNEVHLGKIVRRHMHSLWEEHS